MKMRLISLITAMVMLSINGFGQNLNEFKSILDNCGMNVNIPEGFVETKIIENHDMHYEYAIKYPDKDDFELRYSISPIGYKNYANDSVKNAMESLRQFRNSSYGTIFKAVILNVSGGVSYENRAFDKNAVKNEFNADWGATTFVELKSEFGKGYKYCMIVTIHKDDVADAYYFYLANTKEKFSENMGSLFHTLRFD